MRNEVKAGFSEASASGKSCLELLSILAVGNTIRHHRASQKISTNFTVMAATTTSRRAILVCDVQLGILPIGFGTDEEAINAYVGRCNSAIAHARSNGDKVIFIRVGFEPGHPEVGPKNKVRLF